jgi:5-hydroxyisourate hydrolase
VKISTHVLDNAAGRPAAGVPVTLYRGDELVAAGVTDADGRFVAEGEWAAGRFRWVFDTSAVSGFFPEVSVAFAAAGPKLHVPLLLSPYAYSTYRGS